METNYSLKQDRLSSGIYKIVNEDANLIPFKLNRAQAHFVEHRGKRNIILKSRRLGFTTFASIDALDDTLYNQNFASLILSYDKAASRKVFEMVDIAWRHYSPELKQLYSLDSETKDIFKFNFGDDTYSSIEVKNSGRGMGLNKLHISEFAKICAKYPQKAREVLSGTIRAVPYSGEVTIESTAEGNTGIYHDMFWEAWNRDKNQPLQPTEYKAFFYNWQWDDKNINKIKEPLKNFPDEFLKIQKVHNEKVLEHPDKYVYMTDIHLTHYYNLWLGHNKNWDLLRQEDPLYPEEAFLGSSEALFDQKIVQKMKDNSKEPIRFLNNNNWKIYEEAKPGHQYLMGVDVAEGVKKDHSTIVILDYSYDKPKVVAVFASNEIAPDELAYEIKFGGDMYYYPFVGVERNNHGHTTLAILKQLYPEDRLYKEVNEDSFDDRETEKLGWLTTGTSKPKILYLLKSAVNLNSLDIPSKELCHELLTYDKGQIEKVKFDPEATNHFDLVMALAIGYKMKDFCDFDFSGEVKTISPKKQSKENIYSSI